MASRPAPRPRATALSRVAPVARALAGVAPLARASLALALAGMTTGCLITDPPQFKARAHTRPFLLEATADPDPRLSPLVLPTDSYQRFSAQIVSQDDPADPTSGSKFQSVEAWLLIDYGYDDPHKPYRYAVPGTALAPGGTLEQTREVWAGWTVSGLDEGCHTATLMVSHWFDRQVSCPVCPDDYSSLTWQIYVCDSGACPAMPVTGEQSCEGLQKSCVGWLGDHADAGVPLCPDGGAP